MKWGLFRLLFKMMFLVYLAKSYWGRVNNATIAVACSVGIFEYNLTHMVFEFAVSAIVFKFTAFRLGSD